MNGASLEIVHARKEVVRSLAVLLVFALFGMSTAVARADVPDPLGIPDVNVRDNVVRTVLPDGLTLLVVEDHTTPIVDMEMLFRVGQAREDSSNAGITHLIQNILVRRVNKAAEKNTNFFESKGSLVSCDAKPDYAQISLETDPGHFPELLTTISKAVAQQKFTDEEVGEERRKLVTLLESDQRLFMTIYQIFLVVFYEKYPYRQPQDGVAATVRQMTTEHVEKFYSKYWAPNQTVIAVVGNVDRDEVLKLVKKNMGSLRQIPEDEITVPWEPKSTEKELELTSGSNLGFVFLGYPAPGMKSPDYMAMKILSTILGGGLSSRLWVEIREKRGLAYELGTMYPDLEGPSHIINYMLTTPNQVNEGQNRILKEVERIQAAPVSLTELNDAKRRLIGEYLLGRETCKGRAFHLALEELLGSGYQADLLTIRRIRQVTQEDVLRVARFYLREHTLIVARPRGYFNLFR